MATDYNVCILKVGVDPALGASWIATPVPAGGRGGKHHPEVNGSDEDSPPSDRGSGDEVESFQSATYW